MTDRMAQFPAREPIPRCLRDGPITVPQFGRHPWWRRRWRRSRRIRANFRWLTFRHPKSATLVINVRWGLSG
ncbi:hypothetical protein LCGC14_1791430 [marine sediment metagenome]|uniref:Uncharacterized protein n=1 Tax=marine sediment metagenome TaxID=412755 RepID=A0A0F9J790_9ZZZZ